MVRLASNFGTGRFPLARARRRRVLRVRGSLGAVGLQHRARDVVDAQLRVEAEDLLELVDVADLGAHGDVGHALEDELHHDRDLVLLMSWRAVANASLNSLGLFTRTALQPRPSATATWSTP